MFAFLDFLFQSPSAEKLSALSYKVLVDKADEAVAKRQFSSPYIAELERRKLKRLNEDGLALWTMYNMEHGYDNTVCAQEVFIRRLT